MSEFRCGHCGWNEDRKAMRKCLLSVGSGWSYVQIDGRKTKAMYSGGSFVIELCVNCINKLTSRNVKIEEPPVGSTSANEYDFIITVTQDEFLDCSF